MTTRHWTIDGLSFSLPETMLTPGIARMCDKGWYEIEERRALHKHLVPGDRVLEIGGGAGLLASAAARIVGAEAVTTVEANPEMLPVIAANLAANGAEAVRVIHGAAVARSAADVQLNVPPAFWGASVVVLEASRAVTVPAIAVADLVAEVAPGVLVVDVEGAEADFFEHPLPETLRLIVLELHPARYPRATIAALFARLAQRGFTYDPDGSGGAVVCFSRF